MAERRWATGLIHRRTSAANDAQGQLATEPSVAYTTKYQVDYAQHLRDALAIRQIIGSAVVSEEGRTNALSPKNKGGC